VCGGVVWVWVLGVLVAGGVGGGGVFRQFRTPVSPSFQGQRTKGESPKKNQAFLLQTFSFRLTNQRRDESDTTAERQRVIAIDVRQRAGRKGGAGGHASRNNFRVCASLIAFCLPLPPIPPYPPPFVCPPTRRGTPHASETLCIARRKSRRLFNDDSMYF